jgi:hypothetical protein
MSTTVGGRAFKAPRKEVWPPIVTCLTPTTCHSCDLLPRFDPGLAIVTPDVRPPTKWVRRTLQPGELMTAFEIPSTTEASVSPDAVNVVRNSLVGLIRMGVLRLILSLPIPVKAPTLRLVGGLLWKIYLAGGGGGFWKLWKSCLAGRGGVGSR